jgi:hypothetical protein
LGIATVIEDAGERDIIESIAGRPPKPVGFIVNCGGVPRQLTVLRLVTGRRIALAGLAVKVPE